MKNFKIIKSLVYKNLTSNINNDFVLSNPFFHINRKHPETIKKYEVINSNNFYLLFFNLLTKYLLKKFANFFLSLLEKNNDNFINKNSKKKDFILSHLLNKNQLIKNEEIYMNNVIDKLINPSIPKIILLNCTDLRNAVLFKNIPNKVISNKLILNIRLNFFKEFKIFLNQIYESFSFFKKSFTNNIIHRKFYLLAFLSFYHPQFRYNLITLEQLKKIFSVNHITNLFLTFEGHAIDRAIIRLAKKNNIQNIYGYYHPPLFDNLIFTKYKFSSDCNPDYLITSSKNSYNFFKKIYKNKTLCVPKINIKISNLKLKFKKKNFCLVLPEGLHEDIIFFIKNISKIANKNLDIKFFFQLHPGIDVTYYKKIIDKLNLPNLSVINNNGIQKKNVKWCLYTGSSSVLENVVRYKMIPIHLRYNKFYNLDCLFKIKDNSIKKTFFNNSKLDQYFKIYLNKKINSVTFSNLNLVTKYCSEFFTFVKIK